MLGARDAKGAVVTKRRKEKTHREWLASTNSGRTTGAWGPSGMPRGLPIALCAALTSVVVGYSAMADARPEPSATWKMAEGQKAPREDEDLAPSRGLCASPYPLAGFAQAGCRAEPRRSKAENGYWGRPTGGKKQNSDGHEARGKTGRP